MTRGSRATIFYMEACLRGKGGPAAQLQDDIMKGEDQQQQLQETSGEEAGEAAT